MIVKIGGYMIPDICEIKNIATIKQKTYYYCAAACIKMCTETKMEQSDIFKTLAKATKDKENWYAEPNAVFEFLLNHDKYIRISDISETSLDATEWLLSNMIKNKAVAPMLVSAGKHWVVYSGYQMQPTGEPTGIYVRDPWPTTSELSFYPFCEYFFNIYFCNINVPGNWYNRIESFVNENVKKTVNINPLKKPQYGGKIEKNDISYFKNQIIMDDLKAYGFNNVELIKNGGTMAEDIIIHNIFKEPAFLLAYTSINEKLSITAIDINSANVIAILKNVGFSYNELFNKNQLLNNLYERYKIKVLPDDIIFVYDSNFSPSFFAPIVLVRGYGNFDLSLNRCTLLKI